MGKPDMVMQSYLSDRERFADLYNGVFFQGEQVIRSCDLQEASERYSETEGRGTSRFRDIKMSLKSGGSLRILTVENQANIDYTMPCRCMRYDVMEYEKQLKELRNGNHRQNLLSTPAEWLCGISRNDRLIPVYTLCLYHGEEPWDGPVSLRDMMDFGGESDRLQRYFADYPMRLFCLNGADDFECFHTGLRELFGAMKYRRDKKKLRELFTENERYRHLSPDTAEALSVVLNIPGLWRGTDVLHSQERYRNRDNREEYDMCQAWEELKAEYIAEGREEGLAVGSAEGLLEKTKKVVRNMLKRGFSDRDICELAECSVELIDSVR